MSDDSPRYNTRPASSTMSANARSARQQSPEKTTLTSLEVFRAFIVPSSSPGHEGELDGSGVVSSECFNLWVSSRGRQTKEDPAKAFRRALVAHLTGTDGRTPFNQEEEEAVLKVIRARAPWPCFSHLNTTKFSHLGFRSRGFHEQRLAGERPESASKKRAKYLPETRGTIQVNASMPAGPSSSSKKRAKTSSVGVQDEEQSSITTEIQSEASLMNIMSNNNSNNNSSMQQQPYQSSKRVQHRSSVSSSSFDDDDDESENEKDDDGDEEWVDERKSKRTNNNNKSIPNNNVPRFPNNYDQRSARNSVPMLRTKDSMNDSSMTQAILDSILSPNKLFNEMPPSPAIPNGNMVTPSPWTAYFRSLQPPSSNSSSQQQQQQQLLFKPVVQLPLGLSKLVSSNNNNSSGNSRTSRTTTTTTKQSQQQQQQQQQPAVPPFLSDDFSPFWPVASLGQQQQREHQHPPQQQAMSNAAVPLPSPLPLISTSSANSNNDLFSFSPFPTPSGSGSRRLGTSTTGGSSEANALGEAFAGLDDDYSLFA